MDLIKLICVWVAAFVLGNWFWTELKKTRAQGKPAYKAYLTMPGLLIIAALCIPIIYWLINR